MSEEESIILLHKNIIRCGILKQDQYRRVCMTIDVKIRDAIIENQTGETWVKSSL